MRRGHGVGERIMGTDSEERDAIGEALLRRQQEAKGGGSRGFMDRQRDALQEQVAGAMKQIEQLRARQDALAREKAEIESFLRRQSEYLSAKQALISRLRQGIKVMERREAESIRLLELVREARGRFGQALHRLEAIDEEAWADKSFDGELSNAAAAVAESTEMYDRLTAQIDAQVGQGVGETGGTPLRGVRPGDVELARAWVVRGLAFGIPVVVLTLLAYMLVKLLS